MKPTGNTSRTASDLKTTGIILKPNNMFKCVDLYTRETGRKALVNTKELRILFKIDLHVAPQHQTRDDSILHDVQCFRS